MNRKSKGFAMGIFLLTFLVLGSVSASLIYVSSLNDVSSRSANSKINGRFLANTISDYVYAKVQSDPKFIENATDPTKCPVLSTTNPGMNCNFSFSTPGAGYIKLNKGIESNNLIGTQANALDTNLLTMDKKTGESRFENCSATDKEECASYYLKKSTNLSTIFADRVIGVKVFIKVKSGCGNIKTCRTTTYSSIIKPNQFFDYMYYVKYATLDPIFYTSAYPAYVNPTLYSTCKDRFFNARPGIAARDAGCVSVALTNLDKLNGADIFTSDDYFTVCGDPQGIGYAYSSDPSISRYLQSSLKSASDLSVNTGDTACPVPTSNTYNGKIDLDLTLYGKAYDGAKNLSNTINIPNNSYLTVNGSSYSTGASCSSATIPLPDNSIIASSGKINICGILGTTQKISIVSGGDVMISGDITYAGNGVVSIVADGNIKIEQIQTTTCADSLTRRVYAYMVSINSSIFTDNWWADSYSAVNDRVDCLLIPTKVTATLIIEGSLVGKYQPIFGTYNGASVNANNLDLLSGYKKDFTFDSRVKKGTVSIPYVIPPKTQQWVKLALTEIASTNN